MELLTPGENLYLAIPVFLTPLLLPLARFVSHHLINKDLRKIDNFCLEVKKGNFEVVFEVPNLKEDEDTLITLQRNLNWMAHNLGKRATENRNRFVQLNQDYRLAQKLAFTDPLTGLYNRRYLEDFFSDCERCICSCVSMIYIDFDKFKQVNDKRGHAAGDELLGWIASCMKEICRIDRDIPLRLGGDEFALLLFDVEIKKASRISRRLRNFYHEKDVYGTTLSIGIADMVCSHPPDLSLIEQLTKQADKQAYLAKEAGGNKICVDSRFIEPGRGRSGQQFNNIDPLTLLPNRYLAQERFSQALKRMRRSGKKICLMFLDLDDFKTINDSLGHQAGDTFLIHVAHCIQGCLRVDDSVCRLGGDEFLIIMENINCRDNVPAFVTKVNDAVRKRVLVNNQEISTTASIGVTLVPDDGEDFDTLCKQADIALTHAKENGKANYCLFKNKMAESVQESLTMVTDLRDAVSLGQMELYFQPQIDLKSGVVVGVESLIRWNHPGHGVVSPGQFIPLAERCGLIVEIGSWVVDEACRICAMWREKGFKDLVVAINISPVQIKRGHLARLVLDTIEKYSLQGNNVELEFTESLLLENDQSILDDFVTMREAGIHLALDDFGTGYSNLSYLRSFNITKLKIDMSFVRDMARNDHDKAIVEAIIKMAESLDLTTVAEGVEDVPTRSLLRDMKCNAGQGFLWSKPLPAAELLAFLQSMSGASHDNIRHLPVRQKSQWSYVR